MAFRSVYKIIKEITALSGRDILMEMRPLLYTNISLGIKIYLSSKENEHINI